MDFIRHMFFEASDSSVIVLPRPKAEDRRVLYSSNGRHFRFCEVEAKEQGGTPQYSGTTFIAHVIPFYESVSGVEGIMTYSVGGNRVWFRGREYLRVDDFDPSGIVVHDYEGQHLLELTSPLPSSIGPSR